MPQLALVESITHQMERFNSSRTEVARAINQEIMLESSPTGRRLTFLKLSPQPGRRASPKFKNSSNKSLLKASKIFLSLSLLGEQSNTSARN